MVLPQRRSWFSEEAGVLLCCSEILGGVWPLSPCLGIWRVKQAGPFGCGHQNRTLRMRRQDQREDSGVRTQDQTPGLPQESPCKVLIDLSLRCHWDKGAVFPALRLSARGSDSGEHVCGGALLGSGTRLLAGAGQGVLSEVPSDCIHISKRKSGHCSWRKGERAGVGLGARKAALKV